MGQKRIRVKGASKGKRWAKGKSSSSNPDSKKHRNAAKGRIGSHLVGETKGFPLTADALALHDSAAKHQLSSGLGEHATFELESVGTATTAITTSSVYSLVETAHPVFGSIRKLWKNPSERNQNILATLAAISEVVKSKDGQETETEYFSILLSSLESAEDEQTTLPLAYLLKVVVPRVQESVLKAKFGSIAKILSRKLVEHSESDDIDLLTSLLKSVSVLLLAQDSSVWADIFTKSFLRLLLTFTMHSDPKIRRPAKSGVISLLREGRPGTVPSSDTVDSFHPAAPSVAKFILEQVEGGSGKEFGTLCLLDLLKESLANFPLQHVKELCELILKQMTLANSEMKLSGLRALNGLFTSVSGPNGLTATMNAQLISALYNYRPSLVDVQLLKLWIEVLQSAHLRLNRSDATLCCAHLPKFYLSCMNCLLASNQSVVVASTDAMIKVLSECFGSVSTDQMTARLPTAEKIFKSVQLGLKYKFHLVWSHVLDVLKQFYRLLGGGLCQTFLAKSLVSLAELRDFPNFNFKAELDSAFAAAIETMGPRVVLSSVPLRLDAEDPSYTFPKSWILPLLRERVKRTELKYFIQELMPLADKLALKASGLEKKDQHLKAKLLRTLESQLWDTLPGFCSSPTDLSESFKPVAKLLGTILKSRPELRSTVCMGLRNLIETSRGNTEHTALLGSYAKNYLPILFNLHTSELTETEDDVRASVLECIKTYASVTEVSLLEVLFSKALSSLQQEDLSANTVSNVVGIILSLVPHLPAHCMEQLYTLTHPLLRSSDGRSQKKGYQMLYSLLSLNALRCRVFVQEHMLDIQQVLLDTWENVSPGAKKSRLKCLVAVIDQIKTDPMTFLVSVLPEVLLGLKEANEKTRSMSNELVVKMGFAAMKTSQLSSGASITQFVSTVLAGLAGSPHLMSATVTALTRLVYEFHDLLGSELVKNLLSNVTLLLRAKSREVVKAAMSFVKVIIGVLPTEELLPHLESLVPNLCDWRGNGKNHFRLKSRYIFEKLIRKVGYDTVLGAAPKSQKKFIVHTHKMAERKKRQRKADYETHKEEEEESEAIVPSKKVKQMPSFEDLLHDTSSESEDDSEARSPGRKKRGHAWIQESEEPIDFLDRTVVKKILSTDPSVTSGNRKRSASFVVAQDGRMIIEDREKKMEDSTEPANGRCSNTWVVDVVWCEVRCGIR
jgi:ribosomal RNA-processing protein 12